MLACSLLLACRIRSTLLRAPLRLAHRSSPLARVRKVIVVLYSLAALVPWLTGLAPFVAETLAYWSSGAGSGRLRRTSLGSPWRPGRPLHDVERAPPSYRSLQEQEAEMAGTAYRPLQEEKDEASAPLEEAKATTPSKSDSSQGKAAARMLPPLNFPQLWMTASEKLDLQIAEAAASEKRALLSPGAVLHSCYHAASAMLLRPSLTFAPSLTFFSRRLAVLPRPKGLATRDFARQVPAVT